MNYNIMLKIIFFYKFFTNYNFPYINKYIDRINTQTNIRYFSYTNFRIKILITRMLEIPLYYTILQPSRKNNDRFQVITRMKLSFIWKLLSSIDSLLTTPEAWVEKVARKMVKWVFKSFRRNFQGKQQYFSHVLFSLYFRSTPEEKNNAIPLEGFLPPWM